LPIDISQFFKIFQNCKYRVTAPIACCPIACCLIAVTNPASLCWPLTVFCLFDEKIRNDYMVMKKSLKFSFSLFRVF